jgi:hypothetical protein
MNMANMNNDEDDDPFGPFHHPPQFHLGGERVGPLPHLQAVKRSAFVSKTTLVDRARGVLAKYVAHAVTHDVDVPALRTYLQYLPVAQKELILGDLQANFVHPTASNLVHLPSRSRGGGGGGADFDQYRSVIYYPANPPTTRRG